MANETRQSRVRRRRLLIPAAVVLVWLLFELGAMVVLRIQKPSPADDVSRLYRQHPYRVYMLAAGARSARGHVTINSHGFRGPEIDLEKKPGVIRIACFGGSTTYNDTASTNGHTWPAHMGAFLRDHYRGKVPGIEVINAGTPGYTTLESLIYLESKVLDYHPDVAILHNGLNDAVFLSCFPDFISDYTHARKVFYEPQPRLWEYSPLLSLAMPGRRTLGNPWRGNRRQALARLTLTDPDRLDIDDAERRRCFSPDRLDIFERNVRNFVYVAEAHEVAPVLSTMVISPKAGYIAEVVGQINDRIRAVAESLAVPCIDFANQMPWTEEAFADVCHLRDGPEGLERKGKIFAEALVRRGIIERARAKSAAHGSDGT